MIGNERQLLKAKSKLTALRVAMDESPRDADSLWRLAERIEEEIEEYGSLVRGEVLEFEVDSIDAVAGALIKARILRGWTQKQLAEQLGVSEQMVQKDETGGYEKAALSRLADIADVLRYSLRGWLAPVEETAWPSRTMTTSGCDCRIEFIRTLVTEPLSDTHSYADMLEVREM